MAKREWMTWEVRYLEIFFLAQCRRADIYQTLGRSRHSVNNKARKMGLITDETRYTAGQSRYGSPAEQRHLRELLEQVVDDGGIITDVQETFRLNGYTLSLDRVSEFVSKYATGRQKERIKRNRTRRKSQYMTLRTHHGLNHLTRSIGAAHHRVDPFRRGCPQTDGGA